MTSPCCYYSTFQRVPSGISSSGGPSQAVAKAGLSQMDQPARYQAVRRQARGCGLRQRLVGWHVDRRGAMLLFHAQEGVVGGYVRSPKASQLHLWDALIGQVRQRWEGTAHECAGEGSGRSSRPRELPSCSSCMPLVA